MDSPEAQEPTPPPLPPNWNRCHAYNHRKRRYCRQLPVPDVEDTGPQYCGNHMYGPSKRSQIDTPTDVGIKPTKKQRGNRIPCPVDPSHYIFESSLQKHVLVCPAAKQEQDVASQKYYLKDVNRGGSGEISAGSVDQLCNDGISKKHHDLAMAAIRVFCRIFRSNENNSNTSLEEMRNLTEQDIYNSIPEVDLSYEEEKLSKASSVQDEEQTRAVGQLSQAINRHRIKAGGPRHVHQIASILGHIRQSNLLAINTNENVFKDKPSMALNVVELGAGRGMLGLVVAGSAAAASSTESAVQLFLVDRSGSRAKAETKIRTANKDAAGVSNPNSDSHQDCLKLESVQVTRIKADLAHVHMPTALPFLSDQSGNKPIESKTIVIAKHLCGSGTDLGLKSLCDIAPSGSIDGCVMATCCHGLCNWNDYTGRETLLKLFCSFGGLSNFGKDEFDVMKRWTSASVLEDRCCASNNDVDEDEEHNVGIESNDRTNDLNAFNVAQNLGLACGGNGLGRACQRIIDFGRAEYTRNTLFCIKETEKSESAFDVKLFHYVPRKVTPQNALLMAFRK
jgi:tRNA:m4X modification enzyme